MCIAELVGSESAAYAGGCRDLVQLGVVCGGRARLASCRSAQYAEQRTDWQVSAQLEPEFEM